MNNLIDITFFIESEATVSRAYVDIRNIKHVGSTSLTNFSGSSGGHYKTIELYEPISPISGFYISSLAVTDDEFDKIEIIYLNISRTIISGEF